MLDTLRFVRGAVSTKDLVPVLTHFCIRDGRIQGQNGRLALDAACPDLADHSLVVPADKFLRAVDACDGEPTLTVKEDKLYISRGKFRASLSTLKMEDYPLIGGEGTAPCGFARRGDGLLAALTLAEPFMSLDASRPWSCSVLLTDDTAYATNNVVLACVEFDWGCEDLVLPAFAVHELLRIGVDPMTLAWDENEFTAEYADGSWLHSQLIEGAWPGTLRDLDKSIQAEENWFPTFRGEMTAAMEKLKPFFPNAKLPVILTGPHGLSTEDGQSSAAVEVGELPEAAFRLESLSLVMTAAQDWAPHNYPGPVPWRGYRIRGMLSGVRR